MSKSTCKIRLLDEVTAVLVGLHGDHQATLYKKYSIPAPNYFFNPLFKLGRWDGKVHFMQQNGKTYIYLLEEIIPRIIQMGYEVVIEDLRTVAAPTPNPVMDDMFAHVMHPDTGNPIMLRHYQLDGINALIEHGHGMVRASTGAGKAQPLSSNILTPSGWKKMGDMVVGDYVITPSGETAPVVGVFPQGVKPIYKVTFHDGASTQCCDEHLWTVKMPTTRLSSAKTVTQTVPLSHIRDFLRKKELSNNIPGCVTVQTIDPFEFATPHVCPIPPYTLGALLGDGSLSTRCTIVFSSEDDHIVSRVSSDLIHLDITLKKKGGVDYGVTKRLRNTWPPLPNPLVVLLTDYGLMGTTSHTKFIPSEVKQTSLTYRLDLLKGLFDTDGTVDQRGNVSFTTVSHQLALDVQQMVWAIGMTCTITSRSPTYTHQGQKRIGSVAYTLFVAGTDTSVLFSLPKKLARCKIFGLGRISHGRRIVSIELLASEQAQCIMIDHPEHLYVTDDYIVTHNTILCTGLCYQYGQLGIKTLTIVPSQDLIRQTKKVYIHCGLDTGEYSGTHKTLDHQHIVSTWQALKNNPKIVELFQMVLVDECHGAKGRLLHEILTDHAAKVPYRFGVTGTLPPEPSDLMQVHVALGPVRFTITAATLIEEGVLAAPHIDIIQLEEDLKDEFVEHCASLPPNMKPPTYIQYKDEYLPDFTSEKSYLHRKKDRIAWIAEYIMAKADKKKGNVMCLVDSIAFGRKIAELIPGAIVVNGQDVKKAADRREIYDLFEHNDNIIVIATVNIAGTGLDIPRIFNMITIDLGKSFIRVIQAIGRGLRKAEDKDTVLISDICGDLKYSKKHLKQRTNYYVDAGYPFKKHKIDYVQQMNLDV